MVPGIYQVMSFAIKYLENGKNGFYALHTHAFNSSVNKRFLCYWTSRSAGKVAIQPLYCIYVTGEILHYRALITIKDRSKWGTLITQKALIGFFLG